MSRHALLLALMVAATACGGNDAPSSDSQPAGSAAASRQVVTPVQRYRSDAGIVFVVPATWGVQTVGTNAAIIPPGASLDPSRTDNTQVYLVLGGEDLTDLDAPQLPAALATLLAADNLRPEGEPRKETFDAGGRSTRLFAWRGPTLPSGPLTLHAYVTRQGQHLLMLIAAADDAALTRNDPALRDVVGSLDFDPSGTKHADARPVTGAPPPSPTPAPAPPTPDVPVVTTGSFSGVWTGRLVGKAANIDDAQFTFSRAGHLVYEYRVRGGEIRRAEFQQVGQKVQYIPPNGGVQTITIQALERAPGRLSLTQRWVFEKSGAMLDQIFQTSRLDFTLAADGLHVTMATSEEQYVNGNPVGTEKETYVGVLRKSG